AIRSAAANPVRKSRVHVNLTFAGERASLPEKSGAVISVFKEIAAAVAGDCALIFACDAVFGLGGVRCDGDYFRWSFYPPRPNEFRFAGNPTPAARVAGAFAQFTPGEAKPGRRYRR